MRKQLKLISVLFIASLLVACDNNNSSAVSSLSSLTSSETPITSVSSENPSSEISSEPNSSENPSSESSSGNTEGSACQRNQEERTTRDTASTASANRCEQAYD